MASDVFNSKDQQYDLLSSNTLILYNFKGQKFNLWVLIHPQNKNLEIWFGLKIIIIFEMFVPKFIQ